MTILNDITKLDNYEHEDIFDVVVKLEKSFGLKFEKDAFYNVKTLGDLCDIITSKVQGDNSDDCTTSALRSLRLRIPYALRHCLRKE